ncbi:MAG: hypothetical protein V7K57_10215 [Nostoc sp.]|uniref:hypothetical protein n=1 Tax=Nostoc sp. TaxID=1180 RepID=UPI002FF9E4E9
MIQLNILELAKQGDTNAINTLVSQGVLLFKLGKLLSERLYVLVEKQQLNNPEYQY